MRKENVVFIGDMNKKVGNDHLGVKDNHSQVSRGGEYIRALIDGGEYVIVNNMEICEGGPFTRYDPSDPENDEKKSCLDLAIVSKGLVPYINKLIIDSEEKVAPIRATQGTMKKPDHYPMILKFKNIPVKNMVTSRSREVVMWNTNKEGAWKDYTDMTENCEEIKELLMTLCYSQDFL